MRAKVNVVLYAEAIIRQVLKFRAAIYMNNLLKLIFYVLHLARKHHVIEQLVHGRQLHLVDDGGEK